MSGIHIQNDRLIINNPSLKAKRKRDNKEPKQQGWLAIIESWLVRSRHRQELLRMPDYLLEDIGLTREEIIKESRTPFWRSGIY